LEVLQIWRLKTSNFVWETETFLSQTTRHVVKLRAGVSSSDIRPIRTLGILVAEMIASQPRSGLIDFQSAPKAVQNLIASFVSIRVEVGSAANQGMGGAQ
jgi:hypothetical protein